VIAVKTKGSVERKCRKGEWRVRKIDKEFNESAFERGERRRMKRNEIC